MDKTNSEWQPIRLPNQNIDKKIKELRKIHPEIAVLDRFEDQLEEVFLLRHPQCRFNKDYKDDLKDFIHNYYGGNPKDKAGNWFYYPWLNTIMHILPEEEYYEMRTGRNRNLITTEEQKRYYKASIGILGLSVGSHAALTITMTGGPKNLRLADPDTISGSNLNRIRTGAQNIGISKAILVARQAYEINPYSEIRIYQEGINQENISEFLDGIDLLVEGMDNPYFKIKVRESAKAKHIPVIMATDNGDNIFVDIERFDVKPDLPILNGLVGDITAEQFKNLDLKELPKIAAKIAGAKTATSRMQKSVLEVGKTLYSWPQLGTAANLCGTAAAYLARKIILKTDNIRSGRYEINLESIFESDYFDPKQIAIREKETKEFLDKIGL